MNETLSSYGELVAKGMHEAGLAAIRQARMHGTNLVIWREGKVVEISPDEAEAMLNDHNAKGKE